MSIFILNDLLFVSWFNEVPIFLFDSLFLYLSMFIYLPHVYIQVFIYRGISFVLISFFFFLNRWLYRSDTTGYFSGVHFCTCETQCRCHIWRSSVKFCLVHNRNYRNTFDKHLTFDHTGERVPITEQRPLYVRSFVELTHFIYINTATHTEVSDNHFHSCIPDM